MISARGADEVVIVIILGPGLFSSCPILFKLPGWQMHLLLFHDSKYTVVFTVDEKFIIPLPEFFQIC